MWTIPQSNIQQNTRILLPHLERPLPINLPQNTQNFAIPMAFQFPPNLQTFQTFSNQFNNINPCVFSGMPFVGQQIPQMPCLEELNASELPLKLALEQRNQQVLQNNRCLPARTHIPLNHSDLCSLMTSPVPPSMLQNANNNGIGNIAQIPNDFKQHARNLQEVRMTPNSTPRMQKANQNEMDEKYFSVEKVENWNKRSQRANSQPSVTWLSLKGWQQPSTETVPKGNKTSFV